jgi:hypothetical protein
MLVEVDAKAESGDMLLYRSVSEAERADIIRCGAFQIGPNNAGGKWFTENAEDAAAWGRRLGHNHIMAARVPRSVAGQMYRDPYLDFTGPALFAENEHLPYIIPISENQADVGG